MPKIKEFIIKGGAQRSRNFRHFSSNFRAPLELFSLSSKMDC